MYIPVFGKTVTFANLPSIAVAVGAVVPFYKSCVYRITNCRGFYRSFHLRFAAKNRSQINFNYPAFPARFMNSSVSQTFHGNTPRTFRTAAFAGMWNRGVFAVSFQNSLFVRFILIGCHQIHNTAVSPFLKIRHKFFDIFQRAFARYNTYHEAMLRVISYMIPVISLSSVLGDIAITELSFLTHKCPFLIKLNLIGFRGKTLPTHREVPWHVCRQDANNALQCFYLPQPDALFYAHHNLGRYDSAMRRPFSHQFSYGTEACLFVRKIGSCMFGNITTESGHFLF